MATGAVWGKFLPHR